jgi:sec-independent protein translocase protein TatA
MGLDNPTHLAFLLLVLLLIFGAKRLPEMGRSLGTGLRGFKESINGEAPTAPIEQLTAASTPHGVVAEPAAEQAPLRATA